MIVITPLYSLKETLPKRVSELSNAGIALVLGLMLMFNDDLFASSTTSWSRLAWVMSQESWAMVCLLIGGVRLAAILINGLYYRTPHIRALCAYASGFLWFQLAVSLLPNAAIGAAVFPILVAADIWNGIRAASEAGTSEAERGARNGKHRSSA